MTLLPHPYQTRQRTKRTTYFIGFPMVNGTFPSQLLGNYNQNIWVDALLSCLLSRAICPITAAKCQVLFLSLPVRVPLWESCISCGRLLLLLPPSSFDLSSMNPPLLLFTSQLSIVSHCYQVSNLVSSLVKNGRVSSATREKVTDVHLPSKHLLSVYCVLSGVAKCRLRVEIRHFFSTQRGHGILRLKTVVLIKVTECGHCMKKNA